MLRVGDKVEIINASKIEGSEDYFKNGDITEVTTYKGVLALKHPAKELEGGLVIFREEEQFVRKI